MVVFLSFKWNLFVLSDERMMDITEFIVPEPMEKGGGSIFNILSSSNKKNSKGSGGIFDSYVVPPCVNSYTFKLKNICQTQLTKLANNAKEVLQHKLNGFSI